MRAQSVLALPFLAAAVLVAPAASAGTKSPLSALSAMPGPVAIKAPELPTAIPGLVVKTKDGYGATKWHDLTAATGRGYCLASGEGGYRWMGTYGTSSRGSGEDLDLDRLVEKDGKVALERTRVHFEPTDATITATGRSRVELQEIARTTTGVVVWAFREGRDVVVLARNVERGQESRTRTDDGMFPFVSADGCPYAGARLDGRKPDQGAIAQLSGALPAKGTGKDKVIPQFVVDASLSRVARDPEPMLAVRVRVRD